MKKKIFSVTRTIIINTLITTALTVLIMCLTAIFQGATMWGITIPFEMLLVNFLYHLGVFFIRKINIKNMIILSLISGVYLVALIVGFGFIFGWFLVFPTWLICLVGVIVLILFIFIDMLKVQYEAAKINEKLGELRQREKEEEKEEEK